MIKGKMQSMIQRYMTTLQIKAVTWSKDSHGLFDYQSRNYSQKKFKVDQSSIIIRNEKSSQITLNTIQQARIHRPLSQQNQMLAYLTIQKGIQQPKFEINVSDDITQVLGLQPPIEKNNVFLIVRSLKNNQGTQKGYILNVGDVIKMGKMEYSVLQIRNDKDNVISLKETVEHMLARQLNYALTMESDLQGACRICLVQQQTQQNFLISPCECKGSCLLIHLQCLKVWLDTNIKKKQVKYATQLNFNKFECQICKHPLPKSITRKGITHQLFTIQRPSSNPYIILQSQTNHKNQKFIHILQATKQLIKIGRGHNCQVRVTDISVSRMHAFVKYEQGNFIIVDNNSKFGTLIKAKQNLVASYDKIAIQVGRTVITFVLKQREHGKEKSKTMSNFASLSNIKFHMK